MADRSTSQIYNDFIKTAPNASKKIHGDQDWLYSQVFNTKDFEFWSMNG